MKESTFTRRQAVQSLGALAAGASLAPVTVFGETPVPLPPRGELVNVFEFEDQAKRKLSRAAYAPIGGTDREAFDRITLRPRMVVECMNLNLTVDLLGEKLFAPILVGPVSGQRKLHPEGEVATARGAAAAKTVIVVSSATSAPVDEIAAQAKSGWWYQAFPDGDAPVAKTQIGRAVKAGCKAVCITVKQPGSAAGAPIDWAGIDRIRQGADVPLVLKGIMTIEDARTAIRKGVQGIVVSTGGWHASGQKTPIDVLPAIVDAVGGKVPVLVDGSFRRGSDILKALAFGARAVLVARPVMWGLAAYGADGVQTVLELLQMDLGRMMAGCGKPNIAALDRTAVKIHGPRKRQA